MDGQEMPEEAQRREEGASSLLIKTQKKTDGAR